MNRFLLAFALVFVTSTSALADEICADRPAKATGTCTVKKGHWLVTDQTMVTTNHGTDQYLILAPTIKYGLTQRLDLEAYMPLVETETNHSGSETGNGNLTLRAKYKIVYTGPLEFGIEPFITAPTGYHEFSNKVVQGGALMPIGYRVAPDSVWLFGLDPEVDIVRNSGGNGTHIATQQVASLTRTITSKFTVSGELWTEYNFDPHGTIRQYSSDIVFAYVIAKHFEIDTGANFGLNRSTPATQVFVGLSKRY
jgi:hypothetical protein